jgi:hypothetical protein
VSSQRDYELVEQSRVGNVVRTFPADDGGESIVHVIQGDRHFVIRRPHPTVERAGLLAQEITRMVASAGPPHTGPLMPREGTSLTVLEQAGIDPPQIVVPREGVQAGDMLSTLGMLARLIQSPGTARTFMERVALYVAGYDAVTWELFEIDAVRGFGCTLDQRSPTGPSSSTSASARSTRFGAA